MKKIAKYIFLFPFLLPTAFTQVSAVGEGKSSTTIIRQSMDNWGADISEFDVPGRDANTPLIKQGYGDNCALIHPEWILTARKDYFDKVCMAANEKNYSINARFMIHIRRSTLCLLHLSEAVEKEPVIKLFNPFRPQFSLGNVHEEYEAVSDDLIIIHNKTSHDPQDFYLYSIKRCGVEPYNETAKFISYQAWLQDMRFSSEIYNWICSIIKNTTPQINEATIMDELDEDHPFSMLKKQCSDQRAVISPTLILSLDPEDDIDKTITLAGREYKIMEATTYSNSNLKLLRVDKNITDITPLSLHSTTDDGTPFFNLHSLFSVVPSNRRASDEITLSLKGFFEPDGKGNLKFQKITREMIKWIRKHRYQDNLNNFESRFGKSAVTWAISAMHHKKSSRLLKRVAQKFERVYETCDEDRVLINTNCMLSLNPRDEKGRSALVNGVRYTIKESIPQPDSILRLLILDRHVRNAFPFGLYHGPEDPVMLSLGSRFTLASPKNRVIDLFVHGFTGEEEEYKPIDQNSKDWINSQIIAQALSPEPSAEERLRSEQQKLYLSYKDIDLTTPLKKAKRALPEVLAKQQLPSPRLIIDSQFVLSTVEEDQVDSVIELYGRKYKVVQCNPCLGHDKLRLLKMDKRLRVEPTNRYNPLNEGASLIEDIQLDEQTNQWINHNILTDALTH